MQKHISKKSNVDESQSSYDSNEREHLIRPLELLRLPDHLDGSCQWKGVEKGGGRDGFEILNDLQAIEIWLSQFKNQPSSQRSKKQSIEKLLLWSIVERGQALTQMNAHDVTLFIDFLHSIKPTQRWHGFSLNRTDDTWKPFRKNLLSESSIRLILKLSHVFFQWLLKQGRDDLNDTAREFNRYLKNTRLKIDQINLTESYKLNFRQWHIFRLCLHNPNLSELSQQQIHVAVEMLFYTGMSVEQIYNLSWNDLTPLYLDNQLITWRIVVDKSTCSYVYSVGTLTMEINKLRYISNDRESDTSEFHDAYMLGKSPIRLVRAIRLASRLADAKASKLELFDDTFVFKNLRAPMIKGGALHVASTSPKHLCLHSVFGQLYIDTIAVSTRRYIPQISYDQERCSNDAKQLTEWFFAKNFKIASDLCEGKLA